MPKQRKDKQALDKVMLFKSVDPSLQSLFLLVYFYSLDQWGNNFRLIFFTILAVQLVSLLANTFIQFTRKRVLERIIWLVAILLWVVIYYYVKTYVKEVHVRDIDFRMFAKTGIHDFYLMLSGLLLSGWYFFICFREVRSMIRKKKKG